MAWYGVTASNGTTTLIDFSKVSQVISYKGGSIIYFSELLIGPEQKPIRHKIFVKESLDVIARLLKAKIA